MVLKASLVLVVLLSARVARCFSPGLYPRRGKMQSAMLHSILFRSLATWSKPNAQEEKLPSQILEEAIQCCNKAFDRAIAAISKPLDMEKAREVALKAMEDRQTLEEEEPMKQIVKTYFPKMSFPKLPPGEWKPPRPPPPKALGAWPKLDIITNSETTSSEGPYPNPAELPPSAHIRNQAAGDMEKATSGDMEKAAGDMEKATSGDMEKAAELAPKTIKPRPKAEIMQYVRAAQSLQKAKSGGMEKATELAPKAQGNVGRSAKTGDKENVTSKKNNKRCRDRSNSYTRFIDV